MHVGYENFIGSSSRKTYGKVHLQDLDNMGGRMWADFVARDRNQWWTPVNTLINHREPQTAENVTTN
jgi:hypothetical protein